MHTKQQWCLIGKSGALKNKQIILIGAHIVIGRTGENDIVIPEHAISRNHAKIELKDDMFWLTDLKSKNGTYVNHQKISTHRLKANDTIQVGDARAVFKHYQTEEHLQKFNSPFIQKISLWLSQKNNRYILAVILFALPILLQSIFFKPQGLNKASLAKKSTIKSSVEKKIDIPPAQTPNMGTEQMAINDTEVDPNIDVEALQLKLTSALSLEDFPAAFLLLKQMSRADATGKFTLQLNNVETELKKRIAQYEENGVREFEKLNYDKAITEWQKALSLTQAYDKNLHQKIEAKIKEAQEKFAGK